MAYVRRAIHYDGIIFGPLHFFNNGIKGALDATWVINSFWMCLLKYVSDSSFSWILLKWKGQILPSAVLVLGSFHCHAHIISLYSHEKQDSAQLDR